MAANGDVRLKPGIIAVVESKSKPDEKHEVRLSKDGVVYCDCQGYRWRWMCSHIRGLVERRPMLRVLVRGQLLKAATNFTEMAKEFEGGKKKE